MSVNFFELFWKIDVITVPMWHHSGKKDLSEKTIYCNENTGYAVLYTCGVPLCGFTHR